MSMALGRYAGGQMVRYALRSRAMLRSGGMSRARRSLNRNYLKAITPIARKYGARAIQSAFRGYRARKQSARNRVGERVGTDRARFIQVHQTQPDTNQPSRVLFVHELSDIPEGPAPNQRNRNQVNYRGVRLCGNFINTADAANLFFNYAILSPKNGYSINTAGFFRSNAEERAVDFDAVTNTSMDYHCRPINADKYNIITHKRIKIAARNTIIQNVSSSSIRVMRYVSIKRQLRYNREGFEEVSTEKCVTPIFLVYWYDVEGLGAGADQADLLNVDLRCIAYFRNTRD